MSALYSGREIFGSTEHTELLDPLAVYIPTSTGTTAPVGTKEPNAWGLYDMLGNVYEWCLDRCESTPTIGSADTIDPVGPTTGTYRVKHGGSWRGDCRFTRAAYRGANLATDRDYTIGFRLAARIPNEEEE